MADISKSLQYLGESLRQIPASIGKSRREEAAFGLESAKFDYQIVKDNRTEEMAGETPYQVDQLRRPGSWLSAQANLLKELQGVDNGIVIEGSLVNPAIRCPFAEKGEIALRWDGEISPCLPLLYDHVSFTESWKHQVNSYSIGNIQSKSMQEIWTDQIFKDLRERLLGDNFSPCLSCQNCWLSEDNHLDCMGYEHPTCGGCLWARGLISCP